jgi:hypothetical protein
MDQFSEVRPNIFEQMRIERKKQDDHKKKFEDDLTIILAVADIILSDKYADETV